MTNQEYGYQPDKYELCSETHWSQSVSIFVQRYICSNRRSKWQQVFQQRGEKACKHQAALEWHIDENKIQIIPTTEEEKLAKLIGKKKVIYFDFYSDPRYVPVYDA